MMDGCLLLAQRQTSRRAQPMSAFGGIADMDLHSPRIGKQIEIGADKQNRSVGSGGTVSHRRQFGARGQKGWWVLVVTNASCELLREGGLHAQASSAFTFC
jgi:hypothetical protein